MSKKIRKDNGWSDIDGGRAFVFPLTLLAHPSFRKLSPKACKMLFDLARQYTGFNNGYQCAAWTLAKDWGWESPTTVREALLELEHYGIIERTRQGGRNRANLYGFTFRRIDQPEGRQPLDASPTLRPSNNWKADISHAFVPQPRKKRVPPLGGLGSTVAVANKDRSGVRPN